MDTAFFHSIAEYDFNKISSTCHTSPSQKIKLNMQNKTDWDSQSKSSLHDLLNKRLYFLVYTCIFWLSRIRNFLLSRKGSSNTGEKYYMKFWMKQLLFREKNKLWIYFFHYCWTHFTKTRYPLSSTNSRGFEI